MAQNGMIGGVEVTLSKAMIDSAFTAIAIYNVLELNVIIWMTFKRRRGLYFYSMLVSSWGIMIYALASIMKFYQVWMNDYISVTFITIGWYAMVTGQSLVQYSRLHLVVHDRHKIRWVFYMIIIDALLFHVPTTVMTYGVNSPLTDMFSTPYSIMEKVQVTAFSIQEFIISGLYVHYTWRILAPASSFQRARTRRVMTQLIVVNVLVILLDLTLLATEYANQYEIETTYKGALYSVKLRLEFAVLSQLMGLIRPPAAGSEHEEHHGGSMSIGGFQLSPMRHDRPLTIGDKDGAKHQVAASTTCFAGGVDDPPFILGKGDEKGVLKTTQIEVAVENKRDFEGAGNVAEKGIGTEGISVPKYPDAAVRTNQGAYRTRIDYSPTSSQVEFADEGY